MSLSVSGGLSIVNSPDGHGYISAGLDIHVGSLLDIDLSFNTFPGGSSFDPGISSPLIPGSSVAGGLLSPLLPPVIAPLVGSLLGLGVVGPIGGTPIEPPAGSVSLIDLGGTIINLPGAFKE